MLAASYAEQESKLEMNDSYLDMNNLDLVFSLQLADHRSKHVEILRQDQKKKKKTKKLSKAKLNSRIQQIENGTNVKTEKLVQVELKKAFNVYKKEYLAMHGGSKNPMHNELKVMQKMKKRKEMYAGQIPIEKILAARANKSLLAQLHEDEEWSGRYLQAQSDESYWKKLCKKDRMVRALASSDSFHQMESTLERSDPTINSQIIKQICLAVSNERNTGTHPISRHDTNLVEEERNESEPYYIGFNGNRYTNDETGRDQEEMDMEDDLEEQSEKYSRWGADAAYMD